MATRLKEHYDKVFLPSLMNEFGYENSLAAPRLEKIVINMGVGEAVQDTKKVDAAAKELSAILARPDVKEKFEKIGLPVVADGPDAFMKRVQHEVPLYKDIIDKAGLKIQ